MTDITVIRIEIQETETRYRLTSPDLPGWVGESNSAIPDLFRNRGLVDTLRSEIQRAGFRFVSARLATPVHRVLSLPEPQQWSQYIILTIDAHDPPSEL